jgi:hypothetical protein
MDCEQRPWRFGAVIAVANIKLLKFKQISSLLLQWSKSTLFVDLDGVELDGVELGLTRADSRHGSRLVESSLANCSAR